MIMKRLSLVLLVSLGFYSLGNASLTPSVDLDTIYGGANCKQRADGEGTDCNVGSPSCVWCDSGGVNTTCVGYKNSYNCLACSGPTSKDCGGNAYRGVPNPDGSGNCVSGQFIGQCSRTYNEATSGGCAGGQSACP
jgi:hypothetical protein